MMEKEKRENKTKRGVEGTIMRSKKEVESKNDNREKERYRRRGNEGATR